jgi:hypothetical protein
MIALTLVLCLWTQDAAEAKKLLNALAPATKDSAFSQLEWDVNGTHGVGYFKRQQAWRTDQTNGTRGQINLWNGKEGLTYMMSSNRFLRTTKDSPAILVATAGPVAEIFYTGTADRILKDVLKSTVVGEKLEDVDCSHVTLFKKTKDAEEEHHFWIDAGKACLRYVLKTKSPTKTTELMFTYKVVTPPITTDETFRFQPPADAKDLRNP